MMTLDLQVAALRMRYPQAHASKGEHGEHLILVPEFTLPDGYSANICTLLFIVPAGYPATSPANFWLDVPSLSFNGRKLRWSNTLNTIHSFPNWKDLTWFKWHLQAWDANNDGLISVVAAIRNSLLSAPEKD